MSRAGPLPDYNPNGAYEASSSSASEDSSEDVWASFLRQYSLTYAPVYALKIKTR